MHQRTITKYLPGLERLEEKQLLSAGPLTRPFTSLESGSRALEAHPADTSSAPGATGSVPSRDTGQEVEAPDTPAKKPTTGYLMYRITNPNRFNKGLNPPFSQVLVQSRQPVPGQVYNILFVVARNGTAKTFNASSGFYVKIPQSRTVFPILTGSEQWKPGQRFVFYILTKKYYPLPSEVHSGFEFDLAARDRSRFRDHRRSLSGSSITPPRSAGPLTRSLFSARGTREALARNMACLTQQSTSSFLRKPRETILAAISS